MKVFHIIIPIINLIYVFTSKSYKIYDIKYYSECIIDVDKYIEGYIPKDSQLYFRMKIEPADYILFQVKVLKNAKVNMLLEACAYSEYPSDFEVIYGSQFCRGPLHPKQKITNDLYDTYIYHIYTFETSKYILVILSNYENLKYLSALTSSVKSISKYKIIDISYMNEYQINNNYLTNNNNSNHFLFVINNKNEENEEILIKVNKNVTSDIDDIFIIGFKERQNVNDFLKSPIKDTKTIKMKSKLTNGKYMLYQFPLEINNSINEYLAIGVSINSIVDYFSIYVGQENIQNIKGYKVAINNEKLNKPFLALLILNFIFIFF
jgi:hypothetical protein